MPRYTTTTNTATAMDYCVVDQQALVRSRREMAAPERVPGLLRVDAGRQEGRWLNEPNWQWIKAGRPVKIGVGAHPLRKLVFAKFEAEWIQRAETGTPMTMVVPPPPRYRFGVLVG
jgi:hypothetical protein